MKIREWLLGIFGLSNKEKPPEESVKAEVLLLSYEPEEFHLEAEELPIKKPIQTEFSFIRKTQPPKRPIRKNPMTPRTLPPILQVAKEIMQTNKAVMHVREITEIAVSQNKNLGLPPEEFMSKLSSALAAHLKLKTRFSPSQQTRTDRREKVFIASNGLPLLRLFLFLKLPLRMCQRISLAKAVNLQLPPNFFSSAITFQ